jgi:hypothetical protein
MQEESFVHFDVRDTRTVIKEVRQKLRKKVRRLKTLALFSYNKNRHLPEGSVNASLRPVPTTHQRALASNACKGSESHHHIKRGFCSFPKMHLL